ncbi:MAG: tetratricopeptide repeat protein [Acidobacteriota bacterium]
MIIERCYRLRVYLTVRRRYLFVSAILLLSPVFTATAFAQEDTDNKQDAVAIFDQAQDAHEKGDLKTAIELYKKALTIVPEFAEASYQSGIAYLALKDLPKAEASFRRAVEVKPDWTLPMTSLGSLLLQKGNLAEADTLLTRAAGLDAANVAAFSALAELRLKTHAAPAVLQELLTRITPLTANSNQSAPLWSARAALENALGDRKAARTSLTNALALNPNNVFALSELASIALTDGDIVKASDAVDKLEKLSPSDSTRMLRARVLSASGKLSEALKVLASIDPKTPGAAELKARITAATSENAAEIEKLLENDQKNASLLSRLCKLDRINDPAKALDYCRRASDADPGNIDHVIGYGAALVQAKQFDQAVGLFRRVLEFAPDNSTVHANLASALFELKRYNEAKIEYEWLIERQPDLVAAYYLLGVTHDHLSEYMDAMANYQHFLRIADPAKNQLEIDKVNLRLPSLQRQIKENKGKKGN